MSLKTGDCNFPMHTKLVSLCENILLYYFEFFHQRICHYYKKECLLVKTRKNKTSRNKNFFLMCLYSISVLLQSFNSKHNSSVIHIDKNFTFKLCSSNYKLKTILKLSFNGVHKRFG